MSNQEINIQRIIEDIKKSLGDIDVSHIHEQNIPKEFTIVHFHKSHPHTPLLTFKGIWPYDASSQVQYSAWAFASDDSGLFGCAFSKWFVVSTQYYNCTSSGTCPINGVTTLYTFSPK